MTAPRGTTAAWLRRELECHQSEVVLGRVPLADNDPYAIPNEWLDIAVQEEGHAFVVETRAPSRSAAEAALERAKRFQAAPQGPRPRRHRRYGFEPRRSSLRRARSAELPSAKNAYARLAS